MEHPVPNALPQAELRAEPQGQQQSPHALNDQGRAEDKARHADDAAHLGRGDGLLHHPALLEADPPSGEDEEGHGHRHHAHAADLDQQQDHRLSESGPVSHGIVNHQSGHAGGGGGGEQRIQKIGAARRPGGPGEHQQQRAPKNQQQKAQNDDARR